MCYKNAPILKAMQNNSIEMLMYFVGLVGIELVLKLAFKHRDKFIVRRLKEVYGLDDEFIRIQENKVLKKSKSRCVLC